MRNYLFILISLLSFQTAFAQEVEVLDFTAFENRLEQRDDVLYVYNFWATWCKPCIKEMPYFEKLNEAYADKKVKVVFVSLDFPEQVETVVKPFIKRKAIEADVILLDAPDYNSWIPRISTEWAGSIPATLINMPTKKVFAFKESDFTYEELTAWVDEVLKSI